MDHWWLYGGYVFPVMVRPENSTFKPNLTLKVIVGNFCKIMSTICAFFHIFPCEYIVIVFPFGLCTGKTDKVMGECVNTDECWRSERVKRKARISSNETA